MGWSSGKPTTTGAQRQYSHVKRAAGSLWEEDWKEQTQHRGSRQSRSGLRLQPAKGETDISIQAQNLAAPSSEFKGAALSVSQRFEHQTSLFFFLSSCTEGGGQEPALWSWPSDGARLQD